MQVNCNHTYSLPTAGYRKTKKLLTGQKMKANIYLRQSPLEGSQTYTSKEKVEWCCELNLFKVRVYTLSVGNTLL